MQIRSIQVLRAIAACAVVLVHAANRILITWPDLTPFLNAERVHVGHAGVDLFFVLSGFLMAYLHADMFGAPGAPLTFLSRRLIRIVPIYWLLTAAALALAVFLPQLFAQSRSIEGPWLLGNFFFVPWPDSHGVIDRLLLVGWTLDYEMYFYALFTVALFFRGGLVALIAFLLVSAAAGAVVHLAHPWAQLVTSSMLLEFLAGILLALLVKREAPRSVAWAVLLAGCGLMALSGLVRLDRTLEWGLPAALIVLGVLWLGFECRGRIGRALVVTGDASYSIYLTQMFSLPAIALVFRVLGIRMPADVQLLALWLAACAAGIIFWWLIERPITNALKNRLARRSSVPPSRRASHAATAALPTGPASR